MFLYPQPEDAPWRGDRDPLITALLFIVYITDLPFRINTYSEPMLFADDTSVLITASNLNGFQIKSMSVLNHMSKWFAVNGLIIPDYR
jgi:hypothetical protein